jgi:two-component system chemotaxis response regulator CheB
MPKEAIALGGADEVLPLHEIPRAVIARLAMGGVRTNRV